METVRKSFPIAFMSADLAEEFKDFANSILPYDVSMTQKIDIEKLLGEIKSMDKNVLIHIKRSSDDGAHR